MYFGRIDVLVNNAGIVIVKPVFEHTDSDWDRILGINLKSQYFCMQAAVPIMIAQHFGKIINTCSMGAFFPSPQYAAYAVSKAGVLSLTETVALELAAHNIQVNCVCPGIIDTAMWDQITEDAQRTTGSQKSRRLHESSRGEQRRDEASRDARRSRGHVRLPGLV